MLWPTFLQKIQVKKEHLRMTAASLLQTRYPTYHPMNSIKVLKEKKQQYIVNKLQKINSHRHLCHKLSQFG